MIKFGEPKYTLELKKYKIDFGYIHIRPIILWYLHHEVRAKRTIPSGGNVTLSENSSP